jgi:peptidyl-prolyl cis-trans isomerase B (cyclophilin B)
MVSFSLLQAEKSAAVTTRVSRRKRRRRIGRLVGLLLAALLQADSTTNVTKPPMNAQRTLATLATTLAFLTVPLLVLAQDKGTGKGADKRPKVEIRTEVGTMVVELYNETPQHRDNFLKLVKQHTYDSLLWHRVIPQFMIQGGDPNSKGAKPGEPLGMGGPGYTVPAEIDPSFIHQKGALSAARQGDQVNPLKASSGSQFYVVQGKTYQAAEMDMLVQRKKAMAPGRDYSYTPEQLEAYTTVGGTPHLDGEYTVFGRVVEGLEVIDKIAAMPTGPGDRPVQDVHMWMKVVK